MLALSLSLAATAQGQSPAPNGVLVDKAPLPEAHGLQEASSQ
ncbi:hypothetical protein [Erwinia sp. S38]